MTSTSLCYANACVQSQSKPHSITSIGFDTGYDNILYEQEGQILSVPANEGWSLLKNHFPESRLAHAAFKMGMAYQQAIAGGVEHE